MRTNRVVYDIAIVGAGISGTALAYVLASYTNARRIALIEKYDSAGSVNSEARNNSQTLHVGDIESNYGIEKARQVKPAALMVVRYAENLPEAERKAILFPVAKMLLAVGSEEVHELKRRYEDFRRLFPHLKALDRIGIAEVEPKIVEGRDEGEEIHALYTPGFAVDYSMLARSFFDRLKEEAARSNRVDIYLGSPVEDIARQDDGTYTLSFANKPMLTARVVVFDADAYSLFFAKRLGYGREFSLIPVAGTFYFTKQILRGKVYTMQSRQLPFAAVHGDPDVLAAGKTRWGPTARILPVLESRNWGTLRDYLRVSGLHRPATWISFFTILLNPVRFTFLLKNLLYEIPILGIYLFAKQVRKIAPSVLAGDLSRAKGFGGMRLQRVDTRTRELLLGEGKIIGDNIIFNMTPSPGASVCLYNAMRDAETIGTFFSQGTYVFDKKRLLNDLSEVSPGILGDTSLQDTYAS